MCVCACACVRACVRVRVRVCVRVCVCVCRAPGDVLVVEGQVAAQQGVEDHPAAPQVHLAPRVQPVHYI